MLGLIILFIDRLIIYNMIDYNIDDLFTATSFNEDLNFSSNSSVTTQPSSAEKSSRYEANKQ